MSVIHSASDSAPWTFFDCSSPSLAEVVEQQQDRGAEHRDRRRLDPDLPLQHEARDHERDDDERLLEQPPVGDRLALVEAHHVAPVLVGRVRGGGPR